MFCFFIAVHIDKASPLFYNKSMKKNSAPKHSVMFAIKTLIYTRLVDTQYNPLHKHIEWEIIIPVKGRTVHYINQTPYELQPNEILISKPYDYHRIENLSEEEYEHYDLYFSDKLMKQICDFSSPELWPMMLRKENFVAARVSDEFKEVTLRQLQELRTLQQVEPLAPYTLALYHSLLFSLVTRFLSAELGRKESLPPWLYGLLNTLNSKVSEGKSIRDIVNETHYTHGRLCVLFKQYMGCTLIQYLTKARIEQAKMLMRDQSMNILEISGKVGYDSLSHFIKIFHAHTGLTPKQYRKQILHM